MHRPAWHAGTSSIEHPGFFPEGRRRGINRGLITRFRFFPIGRHSDRMEQGSQADSQNTQ